MVVQSYLNSSNSWPVSLTEAESDSNLIHPGQVTKAVLQVHPHGAVNTLKYYPLVQGQALDQSDRRQARPRASFHLRYLFSAGLEGVVAVVMELAVQLNNFGA